MLPLVIQEDGKNIMRNDALDVIRDGRQQAIEIERFRGHRSDFQQEVEEFGAFLELNALAFRGWRHRAYSDALQDTNARAGSDTVGAGSNHLPQVGKSTNTTRRLHAHFRADAFTHERNVALRRAGGAEARRGFHEIRSGFLRQARRQFAFHRP